MMPAQRFPLLLCFSTFVLITSPVAADGQACLTELENKVAREHPTVRSMLPETFEQLAANGEEVLLLDVREAAEFAVSSMPGAELVDPDISQAEFMRRYGERAKGRKVLLFCSVGVRSSRLAERVDGALRASGSNGAYNLRGGVFAWHNTGRRLTDVRGETIKVHGYDHHWSSYLDFDNFATFTRRWLPW